jgi:hypothetical protein
MHVTSPFTAPELPLVNITTTISPPFQHSKWTFPKTWSLGGARRRKRNKKEETKRATEAHESQKFRLRRRRERAAFQLALIYVFSIFSNRRCAIYKFRFVAVFVFVRSKKVNTTTQPT